MRAPCAPNTPVGAWSSGPCERARHLHHHLPLQRVPVVVEQLEDIDCGSSSQVEGNAGGIGCGGCKNALAQSSDSVPKIFQLYSKSGELPEEVIDVLGDVGRQLAPLLPDALTFAEENERWHTVKVLHLLDEIVLKNMGLVSDGKRGSVGDRASLGSGERVPLFRGRH